MNVFISLLPGIIVGLILASAAGIWVIINRRGGDKARERVPLPPTWPEMWARMEAQDKKIEAMEQRVEARDRAFTSVLADAARQWPKDAEGPYFDKAAIEILADTMPIAWVRRIRRAS